MLGTLLFLWLLLKCNHLLLWPVGTGRDLFRLTTLHKIKSRKLHTIKHTIVVYEQLKTYTITMVRKKWYNLDFCKFNTQLQNTYTMPSVDTIFVGPYRSGSYTTLLASSTLLPLFTIQVIPSEINLVRDVYLAYIPCNIHQNNI